jgi:aldehyde dehydrogenase (NAD+)
LNYPLHQVVARRSLAAALAAQRARSCSKPSEVAPLSAYALAQVFEQIGLPAGVFNLVTGAPDRSSAGGARTRVSTWCRSPGRPRPASDLSSRVETVIKRVALELGSLECVHRPGRR